LSLITEDLSSYYIQKYPEKVNLTISEVEDITSGWETELHTFIIEFEEDGRQIREERVIRLYPGFNSTEKAAHEFRVINRLLEAGYPVPEVYQLDTDGIDLGKPFIIMEWVKGRNMEDELREGSEERLEQLMGMFMKLFVDLHCLDVSLVFPGREDTTTIGYINGILKRCEDRTAQSGIGWLDPLIRWLDKRKTSVSPEKPSVIHKDFGPMNIMLRGDGSPVVIDWGTATVGDHRDDLAWSILLASTFWDPSLRETILSAYESISGSEVRDYEYFEVLSVLRRLTDLAVSLTSGAEEMGMRPEAVELMREAEGHIQRVYDILIARTGLRIPEFEEILESLHVRKFEEGDKCALSRGKWTYD
jgi:aminoglycoside phosphotransferase (APT) family kinase protein